MIYIILFLSCSEQYNKEAYERIFFRCLQESKITDLERAYHPGVDPELIEKCREVSRDLSAK